MERDQRSTCRREERNVGGRGGVMGENNLEFWRNLYNSRTCIYIGVLHLINVAHTHTHTHTGLLKCPGTLVVCPASLMLQWEAEVNGKMRPGLIRAKVYHGSNRTKFASE